ncbi:uncharacterized protein [Apostichopus japonicus]|uniref:uncharacterized protein isoform X2 n=1 Tax=Stichopus japonicus TaxID=307972 RepID=UPI003AB4842C
MNGFIATEKLCDSAWDCPTGLDESDCEPTYLNEADSHGISSYNSYRDDAGLTNSWTFEVPDGFEAVLTSINVNVRYTIIALGAGTGPTNITSHLYSVLDSSSPDLVVPENKFWIKFIRVRSYGSSSTTVDITLRPLQIGGCQDEEFMCTLTRECISSNQTCDGTTNCLDKSDETSCPCSSISEVRCGQGECVKRNEVCSNSHYGYLACIEDPYSCDFKCATWYGDDVIHNMFLCDGYRDCIDGSDEEIENCECKPPAFSCGERCLSPNQVCDGLVDCLDGLDESDCECSSFELPRNEDECVAYWDCCLEEDCIDSDVCGACPEDYFQCYDLTCLAGEYVCDNIINCPAGEDEADCEGLVTALPGGGELPTIIPDIYDIQLDVNNETILSTDDYVSGISNSLEVTWVINAPLGYGIQLQTFGINFGYDTTITIGGGDSIGRNQIAELERYSNSYHLLRSSTVWIHYTSRYTLIDGVIFKLSAVPNIGISDVIYVDPDEKVVIESPTFPQDYPVKVDKVWNFHTIDGYGFLVKFTNFSLEQNWDYVSLGGGVEPRTASQLAAFSGKSLPDDFSFYHSSMWMRFTSDLSKTCQGFRAEITSVIGGSKEDFEAGAENGLPNTGCLVLITKNLRLLCGGTLINSRWVLTSSDDIWDKQLNSNLEVHVGVGDFQESLNEDKTYDVTAIFRVINNDGEDSGLVLMKLNETVDAFATEIFSACLPRNDSGIESGAYVNIFGWNTGVPTGGATLSVSREPVVSSEFCRRRRYSDIHGQEDSFCTGYIEGYGADCYNLYGGPVMNADTTSGCPEVIGVVVRQSYRWSCDQTSQPKIFPLVSSHTALMREIMEFN